MKNNIFLDQLTNNEFDSDEELINFIERETNLKRKDIKQMVIKHRTQYLNNFKSIEDFNEDFNLIKGGHIE